AAEVESREERPVVLERHGLGEQSRRIRVRRTCRHQRRRHHPHHRQDRDHRTEQQQCVEQQPLREGCPHACSFCSRNCTSVQARMMTKRMNATAAATPSRHQRNPSSYISSTRLVVARSGPPPVITYGSEKSWK